MIFMSYRIWGSRWGRESSSAQLAENELDRKKDKPQGKRLRVKKMLLVADTPTDSNLILLTRKVGIYFNGVIINKSFP